MLIVSNSAVKNKLLLCLIIFCSRRHIKINKFSEFLLNRFSKNIDPIAWAGVIFWMTLILNSLNYLLIGFILVYN